MIGSAVPCCTAKSCKATPSPPVFMLLWIRYKAHFNVLISPFQRVESAKSTCCGSSRFTDFVESNKRKYLILCFLAFIMIYGFSKALAQVVKSVDLCKRKHDVKTF